MTRRETRRSTILTPSPREGHLLWHTISCSICWKIVRQMLPDLGEPLMLTLNKQVTCSRHRDSRNGIEFSYIMLFDAEPSRPYSGGELVVGEPQGDRLISERTCGIGSRGDERRRL